MFSSNKNTKPENQNVDFSKIYSDIDNAPIHTMQEDVNALQGVPAPQNNELAINPGKTAGAPQKPQKTEGFQPLPDTQKVPINSQYSPFLNPEGPTSEPKNVKPIEDRLITKQEIGPKKHIKWNKILIISTIISAFVAVSFGGYYFWLTRKPQPQPIEEPTNPEPEPPITVEPQTKKYSIDNPNVLQINANSTATEIKQLLIDTGLELKTETPDAPPVEFVIRDEKNNPVDFSIFSILASLKLEYLFDYLGDDFSLYLYPDNGNVRASIAIQMEDKNSTQKALLAKEKTLITDASFLFLDARPPKTTKLVFSDGTKDAHSIRYVNLDPELTGSLSIDYTLAEDRLIITTSKNSMFEILNLLNKGDENSVAQ